jgi:hypothetical protein
VSWGRTLWPGSWPQTVVAGTEKVGVHDHEGAISAVIMSAISAVMRVQSVQS